MEFGGAGFQRRLRIEHDGQIAAEELRQPLPSIALVSGDTALTPDAGPSTGSRIIYYLGKAAKKSAVLRPAIGCTVMHRLLQSETGDPQNTSVACIGPAGESQLIGASVRADMAYGASRGAPGIIWGSKNLKAISVRGTGRVATANLAPLMERSEEYQDWIGTAGLETFTKGVTDFTPAEYAAGAHGLRAMPDHGLDTRALGKNFTDPACAMRWGQKFTEEIGQWRISAVGSWNCNVRCHFDAHVTTGPFAGLRSTGYAGEVIEIAPLLGGEDASTSMMLTQYFDGIGVDASEPGIPIAMAFEMYDKGLLAKEDTGGLDLTWGNYEVIIELPEQMLRGEGFGAVLGKGGLEAARELGHGAEDILVHIKGGGFTLHHNRAYGIGHLCGLIMGGAGPTWQAWGMENYTEADWAARSACRGTKGRVRGRRRPSATSRRCGSTAPACVSSHRPASRARTATTCPSRSSTSWAGTTSTSTRPSVSANASCICSA